MDIEINEKINIEYPVIDKRLEGEDAYIKHSLDSNDNLYELHRRTISTGGVEVEHADIYDSEKNELLTIKRSVKTSTAIYSFEQSILGTRILVNQGEFKVQEGLEKDRKNHNNLPKDIIDDTLVCRNQRVLWLVTDEPKYISDGIVNKNFEIGDFKPVLLKLKIVDWYTYLQKNTYDIKLYFGLDLPINIIDYANELSKTISCLL